MNTWYLEDVLSHRSFGARGMINCQGQAPAKTEFVDRFAEVLLASPSQSHLFRLQMLEGLSRREEWGVAMNM